MNYYKEIKNELISNEINKKVKNYSINKSDLNTYYNVGKMLSEAGKHYGDGIIKKYSERLTKELGKGYTETNLKYYRLFYYFSIRHSVSDVLSYTHYRVLLSIKDDSEIEYYINLSIRESLSVRELQKRIKNKEYERLDNEAKEKLINSEKFEVKDLIKNPIIIKSNINNVKISEKLLQRLILEDIDSFLKELGSGFSYISNEYKIKIGNNYNYIDLLLFNYIYNCFVVIELKITELKKEHIGQIETYMNYIDKNLKRIDQDKTIGIIIVKHDNKFIMEYCSDERILTREYELL